MNASTTHVGDRDAAVSAGGHRDGEDEGVLFSSIATVNERFERG